jgi:hypothetical protein
LRARGIDETGGPRRVQVRIEEKRTRGRYRGSESAFSSLAPDKDTPRGCTSESCCLCCGFGSRGGAGRRRKGAGQHEGALQGDAAMAPSAPITLPAPMPAPAFGLQSNGHALGSAQKVPGKSNLKQTSTIPSTSQPGNGAASIVEGRDVRFGESQEVGERGQGEGERGTKVQWIDNYGKDLTQVFEFEPRYASTCTCGRQCRCRVRKRTCWLVLRCMWVEHLCGVAHGS